MSTVSEQELNEFRADAAAWFKENTIADPGFMLPLTFMEVGTDEQFNFLREWQNKVYNAGYLGAAWPKEFGGGGLDQAFQDVATQEMAKAEGPIMLNAIGLNWAGPLILDMGTEEDKKAYLKGILSAEDIWCQGFSEPENGSDLGNAQLRAERDGDEFVLNGSKIWTTQGNYAKYMILLARTEQNTERKYDGLSFFLSPMHVDGIETVPIRKLTGEYGFTQTFFTDARIKADTLIGGEGNGWKVAMRTLEYERGVRGGQAGGYVMRASDPYEIVELARKAMRGGKPVLDDPVIKDQLIQFMIEIRGLQLCGRRMGSQPLVQDNPMSIPLSMKLMGTELTRRLNEFAITLQGPQGAYYRGEEDAVDEGLWQRGYLNSFSATIGGGTSQIQRNIIGEHALGLPKS